MQYGTQAVKSIVQSTVLTLVGLVGLISMSCGSGIQLGQTAASSAWNDPSPTNATIVVQSNFTGLNGISTLGNAIVFNQIGSSFILRLEGFSTKNTTGSVVQLYDQSNSLVFTASLKGPSGNQNYYFTLSTVNPVFKNVYIYSNPNNLDYGSALF